MNIEWSPEWEQAGNTEVHRELFKGYLRFPEQANTDQNIYNKILRFIWAVLLKCLST